MRQILSTFLDVSRAAELAGMSLRHFRRVMIESGKLKVVVFNRKHKVIRADLVTLLKKANA